MDKYEKQAQKVSDKWFDDDRANQADLTQAIAVALRQAAEQARRDILEEAAQISDHAKDSLLESSARDLANGQAMSAGVLAYIAEGYGRAADAIRAAAASEGEQDERNTTNCN